MFKNYFLISIFISNVFTADGHGVHLSASQLSLIWLIPFIGILL